MNFSFFREFTNVRVPILKSFFSLLFVAILSGCGGSSAVSTAVSSDQKCLNLGKSTLGGSSKYTASELIPSGSYTPPGTTTILTDLPAFCRVVGVANPTEDSSIIFEVWMPQTTWNGKYLSVTEGGLAGAIGFPGLADALRRGYAGASTDTGHVVADTWWMVNHPEKVIDYGYRAKHLQTIEAKKTIVAFYDKAPDRSYFYGCSNGGRQGHMELQRFQNDYDGFVIGAPAHNWTGQTTNWINKRQAIYGTSETVPLIPDNKLPAIQAASLAQCDEIDGIKDNVITNPRMCNFNPDVLACAGGADTPACLTPPQMVALKKIYQGPVTSSGRQLFPGAEHGAEALTNSWLNYVTGTSPVRLGVVTVGGMLYNRSDWNANSFNFDVDPALLDAKLGPILNATDPNLAAQKAKGIKIIQYHGWADPALEPQESINYYEKVVAAMGGLAKTQDFYRLFMVPSMIHCQGGLGPTYFGQSAGQTPPFIPATSAEDDVLKALENWVEKGVAPEKLIAKKYTGDVVGQPVTSTRPICPHPQVQKWNGVGPTNVASSFTCS